MLRDNDPSSDASRQCDHEFDYPNRHQSSRRTAGLRDWNTSRRYDTTSGSVRAFLGASPTTGTGTFTSELFGPETSNPGPVGTSQAGPVTETTTTGYVAPTTGTAASVVAVIGGSGKALVSISGRMVSSDLAQAGTSRAYRRRRYGEGTWSLNETYDGTSSSTGRHAAIRRLVPRDDGNRREQHVHPAVQERRSRDNLHLHQHEQ